MSTAAAIPTVPFADAKENLSGFISKVVHEHAPQILERSRGRESVLVLPLADMLPALAGCRFDARIMFGRRSVVTTLPQFGLVASGTSFDSALEHLAQELEEYAEDYFSDFDFYRHTDRIAHLPRLLRFVLTPVAERRSLLVEEPPQTSEEAEFWRVVREGGPARRTPRMPAAPPTVSGLAAPTVLQLRKHGVSLERIKRLKTQDGAEQLLQRLRSR